MIISCPSCATRYQWSDHQGSPDRLTITCQVCGHGWVEQPTIEIVEVASRNLPVAAAIEHGFEPENEVRRLVEAAREAKDDFAARKRKRLQRLQGWAALGFLALSPVAAAAAYPNAVVALAPASVRAYEALGYDINIYGLEVRRIAQQYAMIEGQRVLTIRGEIVNVSAEAQKIPWLRFALHDSTQAEVYQWTLDSGARPLRAGESTSFVTRVASPPESAQTTKIRFAHAAEIGSNPKP